MRRSLFVLVSALLLIPALTIAYRVIWLQYPLVPTLPGRVWQFAVRADVRGGGKGTLVAMALPAPDGTRTVFDEQIGSGALDFTLIRDGVDRIGIWSMPERTEPGSIHYSARILVRNRRLQTAPPQPEEYRVDLSREERYLAEKLVKPWIQMSPPARLRAIIESREHAWKASESSDPERQAWSEVKKNFGALTTLVILCRAAGLPARSVEGLSLTEGVTTTPLSWAEVWTGNKWDRVRISTGEIYADPSSLLPLSRNRPVVRKSSGSLSAVQWTVSRQYISNWLLHFERFARSDRWLDQWSLFHLPPEFQETFRILLLIPISALLIGFLRNVVGFPTFGIFMPVLMALAFRNTGLVFGLAVFAIVIAIGYGVRRALNRLRLLLVPRLSVLLTLVVTCLTILALVGNRMGLRQFMAVGLLPIVILTMTIERFFVITEEAGVREGLRTATGSAAVSVITYEIIHWESLQLTFFIYPEMLAAVAALQMLLGRYTGFRLGELFRFQDIRKQG